jgi:hypothetical protein
MKIQPTIYILLSYLVLTPDPSPLASNVIVRKYLRLYICRETFTDVMSALQIHLFMQNKANFPKAQMTVTDLLTMNYEQRTMNYEVKNKANSKPIQTQYKANSNPNKPNFKSTICRILRLKPGRFRTIYP